MYCHILRVCAIPTLESTDSMMNIIPNIAVIECVLQLLSDRYLAHHILGSSSFTYLWINCLE